MYKLVAFDLDGTLFNSRSEISTANLQAIHDLMDHGVQVAIASGRPYVVVKKVLEKLDLVRDDYYSITMNGAQVANNATGESQCSFLLSGELVAMLGREAAKFGCYIHGFSTTRGLMINKENPYSDIECFHGMIPYTIQDYTKITADESFYKVLLCGEAPLLDKVQKELPRDVCNNFKVMRSLDVLLEFINPKAGKGAALLALGQSLGIKPEEIVAFGDEQNDLDMLEVVGMPVAMGNASDFIKSKAKFVTLTNDEDGVAYGIRKIILK